MNPLYSDVTAKNLFKTMRIIHLALLAGQVLFAGVVFFLNHSTVISLDTSEILVIVAPVMGVAAFVGSIVFFKNQLQSVKDRATLKEKMGAYQTALIVRFALLESASLFNLVCYFITQNFLFLLIAMLMIIYFVVAWPTVNSAESDLDLNYDEKLELEQ